jgi:hypothetical protein
MTTAPKTDTALLPTPHPQGDGEGTKSFSTFVREHPAVFIAGGVALGVVIGALIPKRTGSSVAKRALALAATAGEIGLAASRQAREGAEKAAHEAKGLAGKAATEAGKLIDRDSVIVREKAGQLASVAREAGQRVAERASDLASRLKH